MDVFNASEAMIVTRAHESTPILFVHKPEIMGTENNTLAFVYVFHLHKDAA